jgi:hypothetical protein
VWDGVGGNSEGGRRGTEHTGEGGQGVRCMVGCMCYIHQWHVWRVAVPCCVGVPATALH